MAGIDFLVDNNFVKRLGKMLPQQPQRRSANEPLPTVNTARLNIAVRRGAALTADYRPLNRAARRFLGREARLNRRAIAAHKKYDAPLA